MHKLLGSAPRQKAYQLDKEKICTISTRVWIKRPLRPLWPLRVLFIDALTYTCFFGAGVGHSWHNERRR